MHLTRILGHRFEGKNDRIIFPVSTRTIFSKQLSDSEIGRVISEIRLDRGAHELKISLI